MEDLLYSYVQIIIDYYSLITILHENREGMKGNAYREVLAERTTEEVSPVVAESH